MKTADLVVGRSYAYQLEAKSNSDGPSALVVEAVLEAIEPGHRSGSTLAITTPDRRTQHRRCRPQELLAPWPEWLNGRAHAAAKENRWEWRRRDGLLTRSGPWSYVYDRSKEANGAGWHPDATERLGGTWHAWGIAPGSDADPEDLVEISIESMAAAACPPDAERIGSEHDWPLGLTATRVSDAATVWVPNPLRVAPSTLVDQWAAQMTAAVERRRQNRAEIEAALARYGLHGLPDRVLETTKRRRDGTVAVTITIDDVVLLAEQLASNDALLVKARAELAMAALNRRPSQQ